jgi:hypothetical protein
MSTSATHDPTRLGICLGCAAVGRSGGELDLQAVTAGSMEKSANPAKRILLCVEIEPRIDTVY